MLIGLTIGYCVLFGNNLSPTRPLSHGLVPRWSISIVAHAVAECCWLGQRLQELYILIATATVVYYDNVSVFYMTAKHVYHCRTKRIEIYIHFVHERSPWDKFGFSMFPVRSSLTSRSNAYLFSCSLISSPVFPFVFLSLRLCSGIRNI